MRLTASFKLYKICILLHRCNLKIFSHNSIGDPVPPAPPPSILENIHNHGSVFLDTFIRRIRGFRFLMAAGSQSVEGWAKKLDPVQLGKKIHFSSDRTLFNSRASPRCWRRFAYVLKLFTRDTFSTRETIGSLRKWAGWEGEGGCQRVPRAIRLFFLSWNVSHYLPLPGQPPPSAPKMAGIIPLVYLTNINVRSSGQISFLPIVFSPLLLLYILLSK